MCLSGIIGELMMDRWRLRELPAPLLLVFIRAGQAGEVGAEGHHG